MRQTSGLIFQMAVVVLLFTGLLFSCHQNKKQQKQNEQTETKNDTVIVAEPVLRYGLPADSFIIKTGNVKRNQHLSTILNNFGVSMATIDRIARQSKPVFDVRKIRSGNHYSVFQTPDSLGEARFFVYENSPVDYYVFELFDSLRVYHGEKEIRTQLRTSQGTIQSSLWNTMKDNNLDPMLALRLNNIYAWTIDFFAIQKGDRFRIIYEEQYVDTTYIGIGEIFAAQFDHYDDKLYAFRFFQDERFDYFDEKGQSLRKAFLKAPLDFFRISSRFSHNRMHPVLRIRRPHHGVDYAAPKGTPVKSIGDGTVIARAYQRNGGGNYVKIKHNSMYTTTYMHLSGFAKGIATGARVEQGQVIGYVGSTGLSTGPHLDFRVHKNGSPVDPLKVEAPPVEPVSEENLPRYNQLKDSLMNELQKISWEANLIASE
ncbi:Murein DD-endopeptidase MepM and murein hydrolase activator NlpD, contain LysM domain [Tangfeifania diversioriginum]|uniref:Murein DD-endopeptidase MepM and murein hydrolase activator NlpD, contain LysM domain n=1 Tax=Tangfeifania diversioriginum TaxID=1168035 RepID=A0A1M6NB16_9BACT|nr:M23 family metallopeptidase [Tangfeifania diversioriginum]SHJ92857.1 Murein DD-endopeptidase MepM and murein hydrolase activator NlpD, contain LysM domain [Tangfeifania diversioriginum]